MGVKTKLQEAGKATAAVLKTIMAPQVGKEDICEALGYVENAGTPLGVLTPSFVGQRVLDTTNGVTYQATGLTNADWSAQASKAAAADVEAGAKNGATVTATEYLSGFLHKTVLTLTATPVTLTDDAAVGQYGGVKVYDMPAGNFVFLGATLDATLTLVGTEWLDTAEGDIGVGSTAVTDGNALATTEQNIIITTGWGPAVAQVAACDAVSTDEEGGVVLGTTASPADVYVNVRVDDNAAHITASGTITGTLTLLWAKVGSA